MSHETVAVVNFSLLKMLKTLKVVADIKQYEPSFPLKQLVLPFL